MKRNPAGAGYDDDPGAVWAAAGETCLCGIGLSSYPSRVPVLKALTADERRPIFDVSNRESAKYPTYTISGNFASPRANCHEVVQIGPNLSHLGRGET